MKGDSNIAKFLPLQVLVVGYLILTLLYICAIYFLPPDYNIQDIYKDLENHPFLIDILKGFLALSAVAIAWQRSMATEHQIHLQTQSNRISQYYDIEGHMSRIIDSRFPIEFERRKFHTTVDIENKEFFFRSIFEDPQNLNFSLSQSFMKRIENITDGINSENMRNNLTYNEIIDLSLSGLRSLGIKVSFKSEGKLEGFEDQINLAVAHSLSTAMNLPLSVQDINSYASASMNLFSKSLSQPRRNSKSP